jgi:uncharacterized protein YerC
MKALVDFIKTIRNDRESLDFIHTLLTPTEQVMLAKRLGIMLLIKRGYNYNEIKDILKVSQGTIAHIKVLFDSGIADTYEKALTAMVAKKRFNDGLGGLESALDGLLLFGKGRDWKSAAKQKWLNEKEKLDKADRPY